MIARLPDVNRRMRRPGAWQKRRTSMAGLSGSGLKLGINGLGRIGKLTLWHHVARKAFEEVVVNLGRTAGKSLADVAHYTAISTGIRPVR
jgi:phosphoglycerate dehydrogenase-like enzyme